MIYMRYYQALSAYTENRENNYFEPWLSLTVENNQVNFNKADTGVPLTFKVTRAGNIMWTTSSDGGMLRTIEYSKNGGAWTSISPTQTGTPISVVAGDVVRFRGDNEEYYMVTDEGEEGATYYNNFSGTTCRFTVEGNIMSMLDSDGFESMLSIPTSGAFGYFFMGCPGLTSARNLYLPATAISETCYQGMFYSCESLVEGPMSLPATTVGNNCYFMMFSFCTALRTAPNILAVSFNTSTECGHMFNGCTSLATAPVLCATTVGTQSYASMFNGCTSLTDAPKLPATTLAYGCYIRMFDGCISLTEAPALPATTLAEYCYSNMFCGCTSLRKSPVLCGATLVDGCYQLMFCGCSNLQRIECYANLISGTLNVEDCTYNWASGVSSTGVFYGDNLIPWPTDSVDGIPPGWTFYTSPLAEPLTFEAVNPAEHCLIHLDYDDMSGVGNPRTLEFSWNGQNWFPITAETSSINFGTYDNGMEVVTFPRVMLRGNNTSYSSGDYAGSMDEYTTISSTGYSYGKIRVRGNIMSLCNSSNFSGLTSASAYAFSYLFHNSTNLVDASDLLLPAYTLGRHCYMGMFSRCSNLTTAPALQLVYGQESPKGYFNYMFENCSSLNYVNAGNLEPLGTAYTNNWLYNVAASGTFVTTYDEEAWSRDANGIPVGWRVDYGDSYHGNGTRVMLLDSFHDIEESIEDEGSYEGYTSLNAFISDYLAWADPVASAGANRYEDTGVNLEYNGGTYRVWAYTPFETMYSANLIRYALTDAGVTTSSLYSQSLRTNINNRNCPVYAFLQTDLVETYCPRFYPLNGADYILVDAWDE